LGKKKIGQVNEIWSKIANAIIARKLDATDAKISTKSSTFILCVYTHDFLNKEDVFKVRQQLHDLGIKNKLKYKADIYTILDIYGRNKWSIAEMIYEK